MIDFGELEPEVGGTMGMDRVHAHWVLAVLRALEPQCAVEIGCYAGVSTAAIVQALDEGCVDEAHLIDIQIRPTVRQFAATRPRVHLHECTSVEALPKIHPAGDVVVLVDGDHSLKVVSHELPMVLAMQPRAIIAHDVTAEAAGYDSCDGARWLWEELQRLGWVCVVDCRRRPKAATHRGLLVACRPDDADAVVDAWDETCNR